MTRPAHDLMAFLNGTPYAFLHRVGDADADGAETWLVEPLFVADPIKRTARWRPGDRLTPLHTKTR